MGGGGACLSSRKNGATRVDHTLSHDDSNSMELQELKLSLSPSQITTKPNTQEQRHSSQAHTGHGVASLGLPQGLTPKMPLIQGGVGSFYRFLRGYISQIVN